MEVESVILASSLTPLPLLLAESIISSGQLALISIIVVATTLMMISQRRRRQESGPSPRLYAREQLARLKEEKVVHSEIGEVMSHLEQLAREIDAQLDAKLMRMDRCIRDADDRINRLDRVTRNLKAGASLDVTVDRDSAESLRPLTDDTDRGDNERVFRLADTGKTAREIAGSIGRPIGEIDLILALRVAKGKAGTAVQS